MFYDVNGGDGESLPWQTDISGWYLPSIEDMSHAFRGSFMDNDLSGWEITTVVNMQGVFYGCDEFDSDLSGWVRPPFPFYILFVCDSLEYSQVLTLPK